MTLQREDWIRAGWMVMTIQGIDAVKVEAIARQLGVSKGSFYWHFKNRDDLLNALLEHWEQDTERIIQSSSQAPTAPECLLQLFELIAQTHNQFSADLAIFLWAKKKPKVAQRVRVVESRRISYLQKMLFDCGFSQQEAALRSEVAYLAFLGYADRRDRDSQYSLSLEAFNRFLLSLLLTSNTNEFQQPPINQVTAEGGHPQHAVAHLPPGFASREEARQAPHESGAPHFPAVRRQETAGAGERMTATNSVSHR